VTPTGDDAYHKAQEDSQSQSNPFPLITEMAQMAATGREIFESYVDQGFTESQAIYIVAAVINGNPGYPPK
jgi:hypothetical protein